MGKKQQPAPASEAFVDAAQLPAAEILAGELVSVVARNVESGRLSEHAISQAWATALARLGLAAAAGGASGGSTATLVRPVVPAVARSHLCKRSLTRSSRFSAATNLCSLSLQSSATTGEGREERDLAELCVSCVDDRIAFRPIAWKPHDL